MHSTQDGRTQQPDEETALLASPGGKGKLVKPTPLPRLQIFILLLMQLAEPITSNCIFPFINQVRYESPHTAILQLSALQLISELDITGGDEKKVGYYAGLIVSLLRSESTVSMLICTQESLFFATEAMFIMQWSRISDRVGRKPVLLTGVGGLCISMICFGLSKTFTGLVIR